MVEYVSYSCLKAQSPPIWTKPHLPDTCHLSSAAAALCWFIADTPHPISACIYVFDNGYIMRKDVQREILMFSEERETKDEKEI